MHTIKKDQIASISIERGQDIITQGGNTGPFLKAFSNMTEKNTKGTDTLIVTMKNNETYKFIVSPQTEDAADQISFDDLVVNMGMILS